MRGRPRKNFTPRPIRLPVPEDELNKLFSRKYNKWEEYIQAFKNDMVNAWELSKREAGNLRNYLSKHKDVVGVTVKSRQKRSFLLRTTTDWYRSMFGDDTNIKKATKGNW